MDKEETVAESIEERPLHLKWVVNIFNVPKFRCPLSKSRSLLSGGGCTALQLQCLAVFEWYTFSWVSGEQINISFHWELHLLYELLPESQSTYSQITRQSQIRRQVTLTKS